MELDQPHRLDQIVVVLHRPRDVVNIGGVVRAMKNMGLRQLRLVDPVPFDAATIVGIAHRSEAILATLQVFDDLDAALADAVYVVGTTARTRESRPLRSDVRALAGELIDRTASGSVALLFGPEDKGLDNAALDRCHVVATLPVDPDYPSLNLAQAALLLFYELRTATVAPSPPASNSFEPASAAQLEELFTASERSLRAIEFFKPNRAESIMRTLRSLVYRAAPDQREIGLLIAIAYETVNFLRRRGIEPQRHADTEETSGRTQEPH